MSSITSLIHWKDVEASERKTLKIANSFSRNNQYASGVAPQWTLFTRLWWHQHRKSSKVFNICKKKKNVCTIITLFFVLYYLCIKLKKIVYANAASMPPTRTKTKKTGPPLKRKKNLSHTRSTLANVSKYKCIPSQHFGQWPLSGKQFRQSNLKTKHDQFIVWYISKCGYCEGLKKKKSEMIKK